MCAIGEFVKVVEVPRSRPIIAFRRWRSTTRSGALTSPSHRGSRWRVGRVKRANGRPLAWSPNSMDAPYRPDICSDRYTRWLWAYRTEAEARSRVSPYRSEVAGPVKLWGTVAVHRRGYRAQYALIPKAPR